MRQVNVRDRPYFAAQLECPFITKYSFSHLQFCVSQKRFIFQAYYILFSPPKLINKSSGFFEIFLLRSNQWQTEVCEEIPSRQGWAEEQQLSRVYTFPQNHLVQNCLLHNLWCGTESLNSTCFLAVQQQKVPVQRQLMGSRHITSAFLKPGKAFGL